MNRRQLILGAPAVIIPAAAAQAGRGVRLALFGCGGRGTGVAQSFVENTGAAVAALGDLYAEQSTRARERLNTALQKAGKPLIEAQRAYSGLDCLDRLLADKNVDAIIIGTPPYFHAEHLERVVAAGRHVYCEKPVAVDVPGCRRVMETGKKAQGKLSLAVGFQLRYAPPYVELVNRVRQGALGEIVCGLSHYYAGAISNPERPGASAEVKRLRNWHHDRVLSGDIIVEQNIHLIDVNNWLLGAHPIRAEGVRGNKGRRDPGNCSSHYSVNFTYPNDVHITLTSTQFIEGAWDVAMKYFGTNANAEMKYDAPVRIQGKTNWEYPGLGPQGANQGAAAAAGAFKGAIEDADAMKERAFVESITSGRYLNEADQGAESALSAILGRNAAYAGKALSWDDLLKSTEKWDAGLDLKKLI